jgi:uncharacterized protein DUF397
MSRTDISSARWRKSSYSDGQANCVEVTTMGLVAVRDSKSPNDPGLRFTPRAWRQFTGRLTAGHQSR